MGGAGIQVVNRLLALALGIILARTLGADGYGVYAYAFAIMSLLMVAAEAGVPTLLMREVAAAQGREEWGVLRGALQRAGQLVALTSMFVSLAGLLVLWWFAEKLELTTLYTTGLMLLVLPVAALSKTLEHAMRGLHRVVIGMSVEMLLRPLLVLVFVAALFLIWPNLREPQYAMASQLTAATLVLLVGMIVLRRFTPLASKQTQAEYRSKVWLKSALPFTLIGGAGIINNQTDIIMLGWFRPSDEVGIYRVATQGAILVAFSLQVGSAVVAPHFARLYSKGDKERLQQQYLLQGSLLWRF
jgi:O-antigen/teichoic acid export membrane protein